ncbi:predicted protein [Nematostella vectensis]|uniref:UspA domain-containing protein n=1 Tax=Nematostella vectensis TaxID=45351 RepID=A7ST34_NEMVE|nr:predicted protein [Nematostella vectensis]|eukprot:XP_001625243.1 predicted protein [Nematostella vectensis]
MEGRKILIPVDGSEHSERAFDWYAELLHSPGDEVLVVHCIELPPVPLEHQFPFVFAYYEEWSAMVKETREQHEAMLRSYEDICKEKKLHYEIMMVVGKPAGDVICQVARDVSANLIVLGTRGQGMIRRTILGSVSDYVVHHSHLPVAVIPAPQEPEQQA